MLKIGNQEEKTAKKKKEKKQFYINKLYLTITRFSFRSMRTVLCLEFKKMLHHHLKSLILGEASYKFRIFFENDRKFKLKTRIILDYFNLPHCHSKQKV